MQQQTEEVVSYLSHHCMKAPFRKLQPLLFQAQAALSLVGQAQNIEGSTAGALPHLLSSLASEDIGIDH